MKRWKYVLYTDINMGTGIGKTLYYIEAETKEKAFKKVVKESKQSAETIRMEGRILPVESFKQPKPIPVI